jgi:hypothetical protein
MRPGLCGDGTVAAFSAYYEVNPIILCDFEGNLVNSKMYAELQAAS